MDDAGTVAARVVTECALDILQQGGQVSPKMWQVKGFVVHLDFLNKPGR